MGDWNSDIRKGIEGKAVKEYEAGVWNARGDRLMEFCTEENLFLMTPGSNSMNDGWVFVYFHEA